MDWGSTFLWAQILGFIAVIMNVLILQIKDPKNIVIAYIPTNIVWALQFFMIGGYIGAIVSIAYIFRDSCFTFLKKNHHKYVIYLMLILAGFIGFFQYKELHDALPIIAMVTFNIGFFFKEKRPIWVRCSLINSICYILYCIQIASIAGITSSALSISSNIIGMYRHENWNLKASPENIFKYLFTVPQTQTKSGTAHV